MSKLQSPPKEERETAPQPVSTEMHPRSTEDARTPVVRRGCTRLDGPPGRLATKPDSRRAFSLIELIGVLAVIAILAAIAVPVAIKRIDRAAWLKESAGLSAMKDALVQNILRSNNIPSSWAVWATNISSELGLAPTDITTTPRNYSRAFLIDTSGWLGTALASGDWSQRPGGETMAPTNCRLMIVSRLGGPELPVSSGPIASASFLNIWNTPQGAKPADSTFTGWTGSGDDLLIQRINLDPLFHHVILINGYIGGQGYFSINGSSPAQVPVGGSGTNSYYLDGSVLGLYVTNGISTTLMAQEVIRNDLSRVFEYGVWRDQINEGTTPGVLSGLSAIAATFYTNAPPGGWTGNRNPSGGTPQAVFGLLNSFMNGYATWAAVQPCFSYFGTDIATYPPYKEIHDALNAFGNGADIVPP